MNIGISRLHQELGVEPTCEPRQSEVESGILFQVEFEQRMIHRFAPAQLELKYRTITI